MCSYAVAHVEEGSVTGLEARQALQQARIEAQQLMKQAQAASQHRKLMHSHSDPSGNRKQPHNGASGKALRQQPSLHGAPGKALGQQPSSKAGLAQPSQQQAVHTARGAVQELMSGFGAAAEGSQLLQGNGGAEQMHTEALNSLRQSDRLQNGLVDRLQSAQGRCTLQNWCCCIQCACCVYVKLVQVHISWVQDLS